MTYKSALSYLQDRFGVARVSYELITTETGYCNGVTFKVGRSKHTVCGDVREDMLRLFADGIEYSDQKRKRKAA